MDLVRWTAQRNFLDDVNRMMGDFFTHQYDTEGPTWQPRVDIVEHENEFELTMEVPGLAKDDIKISLENRELTISGEKKKDVQHENDRSYTSERQFGTFERTFTLSNNVKAEQISAEVKNGVLRLQLPKADEVKPRQIEIQ